MTTDFKPHSRLQKLVFSPGINMEGFEKKEMCVCIRSVSSVNLPNFSCNGGSELLF